MRIITFTNCSLDLATGSGVIVSRFCEEMRRLGHGVAILEPAHYLLVPGRVALLRKLRLAAGALWHAVRHPQLFRDADILEYYGDELGLLAWWVGWRFPHVMRVAHTNGLELLARERVKVFSPAASAASRLRGGLHELLYGPLSRLAFRQCDGFVALCQADCDFMVEHGYVPRARTAVAAPGLLEMYHSVSVAASRPERVVFAGTWMTRKGKAHAAAVMTRLLKSRPCLEVSILGAGIPEMEVLRDFDDRLHSRIHVRQGLTPAEMAAHLSEARVLLFPTEFEGFGLVTAEAMACGCVPVTTPTGFGSSLHPEEGLVVAFGDREAMHAAVERLLDDPELWRRMSTAAQQRARTLRWDDSSRRLAETYSGWLEEFRLERAAVRT